MLKLNDLSTGSISLTCQSNVFSRQAGRQVTGQLSKRCVGTSMHWQASYRSVVKMLISDKHALAGKMQMDEQATIPNR